MAQSVDARDQISPGPSAMLRDDTRKCVEARRGRSYCSGLMLPAAMMRIHFSMPRSTWARNSSGAADRLESALAQALAEGGALDRIGRHPLQLLHDRRRCRRRHDQAHLARGIDAGIAELLHARNVGQLRRASAGHAQAARSSAQDMLADRRHGAEGEIDLAGEKVGERRRAAAVRHHHDLGSRHLAELLAGEVDAGADPGRCKGQLARISLGERDQFRRGLERRRWVHAQHQLRSRQQRDGTESLRCRRGACP